MKLLIFGGVEFLGRALVDQAVSEGHEVVIVSNTDPKQPDVSWCKFDRRSEELRSHLRHHGYFDAVIDNIAYNGEDVRATYRSIRGLTNRLVLTSSVDIYHHTKPKLCRESDEVLTHVENTEAVRWLTYANGKRAAELALREIDDMETVTVRPGVLFGYRDNIKHHGYGRSLFYPFRAVDKRPIILFHHDTRVYQITNVVDAADVLLRAAIIDGISGLAFNVVDPEVVTSEIFVKKIAERLGNPNVEIVRAGPGYLKNAGLKYDPPYYKSQANPSSIFDSSRARSLLGWVPTSLCSWVEPIQVPADVVDVRSQEIRVAEQLLQNQISVYVTESGDDTKRQTNSVTIARPDPHQEPVWSKVGIGTYKGEETDECDQAYVNAIMMAVRGGINVIDTAINYRNGRSEIAVGIALKELEATFVARRLLTVATKGGFIPSMLRHIKLFTDEELKYNHCIRAEYINISLRRSIYHLQTYADVYMLHNPELALDYMPAEKFYSELIKTFTLLEDRVRQGYIKGYGIATWNGLTESSRQADYLNLQRVIDCATIAGSGSCHFHTVELPLSLTNHKTATQQTQNDLTPLEAARYFRLRTLASAPLDGGKRHGSALIAVANHSLVDTALIGLKDPEHVLYALSVNSHPTEQTDDKFSSSSSS